MILSRKYIFFTEKWLVFSVSSIYNNFMYIYENPEWPDFTFDNEIVSSIENRLMESRAFLAGMTHVITCKDELPEAITETLRDSWAIEGIQLSEADLFSSVAKRLGHPFQNVKTKPYYDGLVEVLLDAVQNHEPLTADRILAWHKKVVSMEAGVSRGIFRTDSVYVVKGSLKNTEIVYEAPPASLVRSLIDEFLHFVNGHSCSEPVAAAIAHYFFVAIHPFEDGNGRIARIISDYVLNRSSTKISLVYVSKELKRRRKEYYEILDKTSRSSSMDVTEWISWFLERLIDACQDAARKIETSFKVRAFFDRARNAGLNERQKIFLERVLKEDWNGALTAKKYSAITACHVDTANRDLKKLVGCGLLMKEQGGSKNTHYSVLL